MKEEVKEEKEKKKENKKEKEEGPYPGHLALLTHWLRPPRTMMAGNIHNHPCSSKAMQGPHTPSLDTPLLQPV